MISGLKVLKDHILFIFEDEVIRGMFQSVTESGIVSTAHYSTSISDCRWGKVIAFGPDVPEELKVDNCKILMSPLGWSEHIIFNGQKLWRTDESKVLAYKIVE